MIYIYLFLSLRERNQGFVQVRQTLQLNCMSRPDYQFYRTKIFSLTWIFIRTNVAPGILRTIFIRNKINILPIFISTQNPRDKSR